MTRSLEVHHRDIQAVLEVLARAIGAPPASRAAEALHRILAPFYREPYPELAWHFSQLTGDGFPLEFTFTSADAAIRYTADVAGPPVPPGKRLARAVALLDELGQRSHGPLLEFIGEIQRQASSDEPLTYGAWVGGRHGRAATAEEGGDRYKLYGEIPPAVGSPALPFLDGLWEGPPELPDREVRLRILGHEPATGKVELYFRIERLWSYHLLPLMRRVGLAERVPELMALIEAAYPRPLDDKVPGGSVGVSYAFSLAGQPPVFTLFLFARALWGGDARIRRRLAVLAATQGWDMGAYNQVTTPLSQRDVYQTYHGLAGFAVALDHPIQLSIGVRPPPRAMMAARAGEKR